MPLYSSNISKCLFDWAKKVQECNGDTNCLELATKELRESMDNILPPSKKIDFETDKTNYILSTIFFLSNRLGKAIIGLSEFDKMMKELEDAGKESQDCKEYENIQENIKIEKLNEILAKYF